jgi:hypothetical protein
MGLAAGLVYSFLVLVLTLVFCRRRKKQEELQEDLPQRPRDTRPILTLNGTSLLSNIITNSELLVLQDLTQRFRVYIPFLASDNESEANLCSQFEAVVPRHRLLFYQTDLGYKSILRQLSPQVHLETSSELALEMQRFLESIVMVSENQCEGFLQVIYLEETPGFLRSLEKGN